MADSSVPRQFANFTSPLGQLLPLAFLLRHQLHRVERSGIRDYRLLGLDYLSVLQPNTHSTSVFDQNLIDMRVQLQLASVLLETALQGLAQLARSSDGYAESGLLFEEPLEDVQQVSRHGSLGRETAEDAHRVDKVPQERHGDELVNRLGQIVERQREVTEHIGVGQNEGQRAGRRGEESRVLTEVQKRHGLRAPAQRLEAVPERVPLPNGLGAVLTALVHEQLIESRAITDGETPVTLGGPVAKSLVGLDWHGLLEDVEYHPQRVETRPVESLEDGRSDLEAVLSSVVHPREGVRAPSHLDVTLEAEDAAAVLGRQCRTG
mmetsp:Transcript_17289/g.38254  ORF Transcript_17289/g.38254 Transcript_17289/m.38254 type:complete len:321 (-) Transcript_17289:517-1479(-)